MHGWKMHGWKTFATIGWMLGFVWLGGPAWAQSRPFLIFFDFQRTEVSPTAKQIVAIVKKTLKPNARITIAGHSDTAEKGPARVSLTRALEVQKALIGLGVPDGTQLTVVGRGATRPLVKTGPNVREPQNRRAEITIE